MSTPGSNPHRPVEDYDVDRLQVEARQRVKLSSTNWSCGLTFDFTLKAQYCAIVILGSIKVSGGHSEGATPVPFPNTEVKPFSADGTARETVWESRSSPG